MLLESACSTEYAPFDEYVDNSIFHVIVLAKLASGDKELRKETVTEAAGLWGLLKVVNHGVPIDVIRKNLALARDVSIRLRRKATGWDYRCGCIIAILYPWYYTTVLYNTLNCALYYITPSELWALS